MNQTSLHSKVGVVAIGRNEGERLKQCLQSLQGCADIVYVDSGSTDGSVAYAKSVGAYVQELDLSQPFTAARARNAGFAALTARNPGLEYVMFVDGDCQVRESWLPAALPKLAAEADLAVVCGRRRERFPDRTLYNFLCDVEWDTPVGDAAACGGDAIYKVTVFSEVEGFNDTFIAGEEPELCFRIRQKGYRICRIDEEMTLHDADMTKFQQWWKRCKRSGYAFFLNAHVHGSETEEKFKRKEVKSIIFWAGAFYVCLLASLALWTLLPVLAFIVIIFLQAWRMSSHLPRVKNRYGSTATYKYALMVMFGKIPQFHGVLSGFSKALFRRQHTLVEYK